MTEEATAEKEEKAVMPKADAADGVVVEGESAAAAGATEAGENTKRSNRKDLYKNQPKPVRQKSEYRQHMFHACAAQQSGGRCARASPEGKI